ncbi:DUF4097 family beta strand repeat-containing protein [Streptomyces sp. URMC 123]|uniref:DUF4097 family beta strand repeat-containing protein n=1 Tax=Streptomyces sp. URMC 123 TaxID=3423403 RepID=UPI003F1A9AA2
MVLRAPAPRRPRSRAAVLATLGTVAAAALLTGCGGASADDAAAEQRSFPLGGKQRLTIEADNSRLVLQPADVKDVEVTRRVDGWAVFGSGPEPRWTMTDGTLKLELECSGLITDCEAEHVVKVPRGVALSVRDGNGDVTADGFDTALEVDTSNGGVTVRNVTGPLRLSTENGEIKGTGLGSRQVTAVTSNGGQRLAFTTAPDRLEATSDNGDVDVELPRATYKVRAEADNGEARVDVPRDDTSAHTVTARTSNGGITLRTAN